VASAAHGQPESIASAAHTKKVIEPPSFAVAGSTSLSLLFVRLLVSHVALPWLAGRRNDGDEDDRRDSENGRE